MVRLKSPEEIQLILEAGKILGEILRSLKKEANEGIPLKLLDKKANEHILKLGAEPAFLNYRPDGARKPYEYSICTSVNEVVVHGIPSNRTLSGGDILTLDLGVRYKGFYADSAVTIPIGEVSGEAVKLLEATKRALNRAIQIIKPGRTLGDIGFEITKVAKKYGFRTVRGLTGHGIGFELHEEPTVLNFGKRGEGIKLEEGMVLAIEPMFSAGTEEVVRLKDDSWATADGGLSAHFEHTVAITKNGAQILTL